MSNQLLVWSDLGLKIGNYTLDLEVWFSRRQKVFRNFETLLFRVDNRVNLILWDVLLSTMSMIDSEWILPRRGRSARKQNTIVILCLHFCDARQFLQP